MTVRCAALRDNKRRGSPTLNGPPAVGQKRFVFKRLKSLTITDKTFPLNSHLCLKLFPGPLNDVGILPRLEWSSWGFIRPFVAHKMSLCVGSFTKKRKGNAEQRAPQRFGCLEISNLGNK